LIVAASELPLALKAFFPAARFCALGMVVLLLGNE
jgi:hypothetical protein